MNGITTKDGKYDSISLDVYIWNRLHAYYFGKEDTNYNIQYAGPFLATHWKHVIQAFIEKINKKKGIEYDHTPFLTARQVSYYTNRFMHLYRMRMKLTKPPEKTP